MLRLPRVEAPDHTTGKPRPFFGAGLISYTAASERRLVDTVAKGEVAEASLDALIRRRHDQRAQSEGERAREELYAESTRRHHEKLQQQRWWEWLRFHEGQIRRHTATLEALIGDHRKEAERYAALLGVEPIDETTKVNGHKRGAA
jgi:hypothetical protein